ncbi:MAG: DUF5302 family protein [Candidatus Nanopelagicales bacterium]|nr:DUF5302 family protein [Candidatus Nanopelagicales bacterium]
MPEDQLDDQREKFKAALEAKKHKSHQGGQAKGGANASAKDASNRAAGGKREHRRKSG